MKISVVGGGNIGTLMAGELAYKGHEVTVCTSKPEKWDYNIDILDDSYNVLMTGTIANITSDMEEAVSGAELVWVVVPAELFNNTAQKMLPYVTAGQMIGIVPGSGGAEFEFRELVQKGAILFGIQRVHSIARLEEYGKSVHMLGRKSKLELGSIPSAESTRISEIVSRFFDMPCDALPNYLCVTLTPSNPILHTARLYSMFEDYKPGVVYPRNFRFYEEWDIPSSEMLIACDNELQELCKVVPLELESVMSLRDYYESQTAEAMTAKISGIKAFKGLLSPMVQEGDSWIPDFDSRYFTTDFPRGLKIIKDFAAEFDVPTPNIDIVWNWYEQFDSKHAKTAFELKLIKEELL